MDDDVPLHHIEPIVTPESANHGTHRMRVEGGWIYWLLVAGSPVSQFVPDAKPR